MTSQNSKMSENSTKREIGSFFGTSEFQTFTWKIPNVSSTPHKVDYAVQSPLFSFEGASWIFKMYPYGQSEYNTRGFIDVVIERLHSDLEKHSLSCRMHCETIFNKELYKRTGTYVFEPPNSTKANICRYMENLKECPEKWQFAENDTFSLVFRFRKTTPTLEDESSKAAVGKRYPASVKSKSQEIGELIKDNGILRTFMWKICMNKFGMKNGTVGSFPFPDDYQVQSAVFNLDSASWILKMYPYFRMKKSSKPSCDVILERLHSEIPEHHVTVLMRLPVVNLVAEGSFFFSSCNSHRNVINLQFTEGNIATMAGCLHFDVEIFIKKNVEIESDFMKVVKSTVGCTCMSDASSANPSNKVLQDFKKLFLNQEQCDVIIKVKEKEFQAHKAILIARSNVFASTFRNDMKEKATGVIDIEDCDPSSFSDFLCFLYCANVESISTENVFNLFTTADKYDVQDLRSKCLELMQRNLSVDTFCSTLTLALQHFEKELLELTIDFFAKHFQEIIVTVKWQSFIVENPIQANEIMIKALVSNKK